MTRVSTTNEQAVRKGSKKLHRPYKNERQGVLGDAPATVSIQDERQIGKPTLFQKLTS